MVAQRLPEALSIGSELSRLDQTSIPARLSPLRLDDRPAPPLEFSRQLLARRVVQHLDESPLCRLLCGRQFDGPIGCWRRRVATNELFLLKLLDEGRGLVDTELAAGLPLGEPHRPAGVSKVGVSRVIQEYEQALQLST